MNTLAKVFIAIAIILVIVISTIIWKSNSPSKSGSDSSRLFKPAKSSLTKVYQEIGDGIGEIPTVSSGFNTPLHIFITDSNGVAIGAWVHLQIKTATVGQAVGSAFRQMANRASEPTWPTTTNELHWFPPEGEVIVAAERKMNVWVTRVQTPPPAGSSPTPPGARVVIRKIR